MLKKSDILLSILAGEMIAIASLPIIYVNFAATIGFSAGAVAVALILPVLSVIGIFTADFLAKFFAPFWRLSKFILVGFLNTIIDIGILNLMIIFTGVTSGFLIGGVNVPGFGVALFNSYLWNKNWVFADTSEKGRHSDFFSFFAVSIVGLLINSAMVIAITTAMNPLLGMNQEQWATLSKVPAAFANFIWNFTGYKMFVFVKKRDDVTPTIL